MSANDPIADVAIDGNQSLEFGPNPNSVLRMNRLLACVILACLSAPVWGRTQDEMAGTKFRITLFHESESKGNNGSSSSSSGGHEYLEQILTVREDGVERLFDIPLEPDDQERLISWQFPVRVLEGTDGSIEILNRGELERRRDAWLEAAEIPTEACGTWYFTWNAFQVECDPDAIRETIRAINIQPENLVDGAIFMHPAAIDPGRLQRDEGVSGTFIVKMAVNADYFHRTAAESDVIVGEIMREPISFEEAYAKRKAEQITGTIDVVLTANAIGQVTKRVTLIETKKVEADGVVEHTVSAETIERVQI